MEINETELERRQKRSIQTKTTRKLQTSISDEHTCKNTQFNTQIEFNSTLKNCTP